MTPHEKKFRKQVFWGIAAFVFVLVGLALWKLGFGEPMSRRNATLPPIIRIAFYAIFFGWMLIIHPLCHIKYTRDRINRFLGTDDEEEDKTSPPAQ
ncbi:MAG: hypothetical protein A2945_04410 [Candidatus Liptonbacteria bacterium RIFCSPLOWO2_01_FULL_52_25]|uniref:Uncharacterized protein n=1 Tax=Candidatus Liptonbacteria bacterium RIFCSPLOWO2_01_FULL_52_25 TaxID=1798650 RepID=A0A1G2CFR7_9BACT|nr:MAG: hypothetical protein A2945_04410 [Candidatus Liptonbacteria bacterium RIFCSPLOWO2_01_FULL_52_25]